MVDEIHALAESKRGDQLMLALARLQALCPGMRRVGLSATVEDPPALARFLGARGTPCAVLNADPGPEPDIAMLETAAPPPWAGGGAAHAIPEVLAQVRRHRTTLIFHNTRAQAEIFFHNLWLANDDALPIGIHHGSLDRVQRERVEAAMVAGHLRAIVCTGSLDLGLDWGDVDLVIQIGAPKNVKRLVQRIGRANHRYNAPSKALLVPANRFEVVECHAALQAARARDLDGDPRGAGPRDVLCQHILIRACAGPFDAGDLFDEMRGAGPYAALTRAEFDACLDFCATGGYALRAYDRWQRLKQRPDGLWQLRDPRAARGIRMNIGTIQDTDTLKVRMKRQRGGKPLGEIEEGFAATLSPGDTFLMGGQIVRFESLREMVVEVSRDPGREPKIATYMGTKFATSTQLSERILTILGQDDWPDLPGPIRDWLHLQRKVSQMPQAGRLLIESFPHGGRAHTCIYGFAGRNAMQTLGLLVTKRMEEEGLAPMGFVATDYATLIWGLEPLREAAPLFAPETLRHGLDQWLMSNAVMKRTFRASATIAGLIQRNSPQARKSGRQTTMSSDIIYDTLVKYDPGPSASGDHPRRGDARAGGFRPHRGDAGAHLWPHRAPPSAPRLAARRAALSRGGARAGRRRRAGAAPRRGGHAAHGRGGSAGLRRGREVQLARKRRGHPLNSVPRASATVRSGPFPTESAAVSVPRASACPVRPKSPAITSTKSARSPSPIIRCPAEPSAAACEKLATVTAASGKLSAQNDSENGSAASRGACTATISTKK